MGRQNFIDRWVDNKSYQYSLSIFILVDPEKVNFSEFAISVAVSANIRYALPSATPHKTERAARTMGCPLCWIQTQRLAGYGK
jgi:hypothetical protein